MRRRDRGKSTRKSAGRGRAAVSDRGVSELSYDESFSSKSPPAPSPGVPGGRKRGSVSALLHDPGGEGAGAVPGLDLAEVGVVGGGHGDGGVGVGSGVGEGPDDGVAVGEADDA